MTLEQGCDSIRDSFAETAENEKASDSQESIMEPSDLPLSTKDLSPPRLPRKRGVAQLLTPPCIKRSLYYFTLQRALILMLRRKRVAWDDKQDTALLGYIKTCGYGAWRKIAEADQSCVL